MSDLAWGSHLPILIKLMNVTNGDVLELGMGVNSTPFLHWACYPNRKLVSYENNKECFESFKNYAVGRHEVNFIEDWDKAKIEWPWNIVLVDHAPMSRRPIEVKRLVGIADYIIVHDTQKNFKTCNFDELWPLFKYRYDYIAGGYPRTTVLSNFIDLEFLK